MIAIYAALIASQVMERDVQAERSRVADIVFAAVQVDMIRDWTRPKEWARVVGDEDARLLRSMNCDHYECREIVTEVLRKRGVAAMQTISWGRHARDPEVASRCENLLAELLACTHCKVCDPDLCKPSYRYVRPDYCCYCEGTGTLLLTRIYVGEPELAHDMRVWGYKNATR